MASNIPGLLQVSTCGLDHALRSAPAETRRGRGIHVPLWKPTSPASTRKKLSEQTEHKWKMNSYKQTLSAREARTHYNVWSVHNRKNNVMACSHKCSFARKEKPDRFLATTFVLARKKNACTSVYNTRHEICPEVHNCRGFYFILYCFNLAR